jgi:DNA polymerase, archaea type
MRREASAVKAYQKRGFQLSPGMEIGYVIKDAAKWQLDTEKDASGFDEGYYGKLLEKAWGGCQFVFKS